MGGAIGSYITYVKTTFIAITITDMNNGTCSAGISASLQRLSRRPRRVREAAGKSPSARL